MDISFKRQRTIQTLYNDIYGQVVSSTGSGTS